MILNPSETVEDLGGGYQIIQDKDKFCYGTDAAVLASFSVAKPKEKVIDLCSGTGIIPILMCKNTRCKDFTALEIQEEMCDLLNRSISLNNLEERLKVICGDLKNIKQAFSFGTFDVVTCNPPYMVEGTGKKNESESVRIARHEVLCTLEDVIFAASHLLNTGGRFYMVHRPERLTDILATMRKYKLEPKRMTMVHANPDFEPSLVLIEGQKDRKSGLLVTKPLYINI